MSVAGSPDAKEALLDVLRANVSVTTLVPVERITMKLPDTSGVTPISWITATYAGGPAPHPYVPFKYPRLTLRCYGPNPWEAQRLARTVQEALDPASRQAGVRRTTHGATILDIAFETSDTVEEVTNGWYARVWPGVVLTMIQTAASS